jgi:hypothetical protein
MKVLHTGTCGTCYEPVQYQVQSPTRLSPSRTIWVHSETGTWFGMINGPHDCNTHVIRTVYRVRCHYADGGHNLHPYPYTNKSSAYRAGRRLSTTGGIERTEIVPENSLGRQQ